MALSEIERLKGEVAKLKLLIRTQQIQPPDDPVDELTTEFAVENAYLEQQLAAVKDENHKLLLLNGEIALKFGNENAELRADLAAANERIKELEAELLKGK
jgi:predicted RNase H-like nuclease (RuvC/YqgF family)